MVENTCWVDPGLINYIGSWWKFYLLKFIWSVGFYLCFFLPLIAGPRSLVCVCVYVVCVLHVTHNWPSILAHQVTWYPNTLQGWAISGHSAHNNVRYIIFSKKFIRLSMIPNMLLVIWQQCSNGRWEFTKKWQYFNSLAPEKCGCNIRSIIFKSILGIEHLLWNWSAECHRTPLVRSQQWFRQWLGAIWQQAITWTNVDIDLWHHMVSKAGAS